MEIQLINYDSVNLTEEVIGVIDFGNVTIATQGLSPEEVYTKTETDTLLSAKSNTNHNHNLADLTEKSYNSLTDKPEFFDGSYNSLSDVPTEFVPTSHNHSIANVTDLQTTLDSKQATLVSGVNLKTINNISLLGSENIVISGGGTSDHAQLTNRDIADQHHISSITGLETALNGKADSDSVYDISTMNTLLSTKSDTSHNHSLNNLTEKNYSSLSNIPTEFNPSAHNQAISTITDLQTELDIKIEQSSCGSLSNAVCTNNGDGTINVPSLDVTLYNGIRVEKYTLATTNNIALTDNTMNYIVADYNSGSPIIKNITNVTLIDELYIIPLCSIYRNGTFLHTQHWDALGFNLANKIHRSIVKTERYRRESGLALSLFGTRNVALTQGTIYVGAVENVLSAIDSTIDNVIFYTHVSGAWVLSTNTQLNNTQYDNGTNLVTLTANRYAINWLYRGVESQKHLYCVLGSGDYTLTQAQTAQPPSIPTAISSHAVLVGRVIIQLNSNTATQIDSAFDVTFNQASTTIHNDLSGLNDGDFKHLTATEYNNRAEISDIPTNFDSLYYRESEIDTLLSAKSDTTHNHALNNLTEKSYNSLTDKPTLFSGSYTDLSNIPSSFTPSAHTQAISTITDLQTALGGKINNYTRSAVTTLTIDCSTADIFGVTLTANTSFSLTNVPTNKDKAFEILNNSGAEITITLPSSQFWESQTVKIGAGKMKEFTVRSNGTRQIWHVSAELKNA